MDIDGCVNGALIEHLYSLTLDDLGSAWSNREEVRDQVDKQLAKPVPGPFGTGWQAEADPDDPYMVERLAEYGPNPFDVDDDAAALAQAYAGGE